MSFDYRRTDQPMRGSQIKPGQMPAGNEICDVASCDPQSAIDDPHDLRFCDLAGAIITGRTETPGQRPGHRP